MQKSPQVPSLSHSDAAVDILSAFYGVKHVIYVEGPDDEAFWSHVITHTGLESFKIKVAGGSAEIDKYTQAIINSDSDIVVCRDQDYLGFTADILLHPRIIYTYGHSIENSLYCANAIASLIADYCRTAVTDVADVEIWQSRLELEFNDILVYDVAKYLFKPGIGTILSDNCIQFLKGGRSADADPVKLSNYIQFKKNLFSQEQIEEARLKVSQDKRNVWFKIRGHFLTHAVMKHIKHSVHRGCKKDITMSHDNLFVELLARFTQNCWGRVDMSSIQSQILALIAAE